MLMRAAAEDVMILLSDVLSTHEITLARSRAQANRVRGDPRHLITKVGPPRAWQSVWRDKLCVFAAVDIITTLVIGSLKQLR